MCTNTTLIFPKNHSLKPNPFHQIHQIPTNFHSSPVLEPKDMWRSIARRASLSLPRNPGFSADCYLCSVPPISSFLGSSQDLAPREKIRTLDLKTTLYYRFSEMGSRQNGELSPFFGISKNPIENSSGYPNSYRGFASVAEAICSTDVEEEDSSIDEIQELLEELSKDEERGRGGKNENLQETWQKPSPHPQPLAQQQQKLICGMGQGKYAMLRRKQIKIETEAWEQAAKEYKELLKDMCEQKLAPNLPYMKSLFLGWFEPLRDKIAADQKLGREAKNKTSYSHHFDQLPAEMMAVITMHKLMGLLMTGSGDGSVRVVPAAIQIGEAIEQEVVPDPQVFGENEEKD